MQILDWNRTSHVDTVPDLPRPGDPRPDKILHTAISHPSSYCRWEQLTMHQQRRMVRRIPL